MQYKSHIKNISLDSNNINTQDMLGLRAYLSHTKNIVRNNVENICDSICFIC